MKIMALILARGGSQRVPNKNIALLGGKPLIDYTVNCAKESKLINRIIVSTNDEQIAQVARDCGAETPFPRPEEISQGDSTELDAFKHALDWLKENENYEPDYIVKIFPTSPFRKPESVDQAIELLMSEPSADSVRSVRMCNEHPFKMWTSDGKWLKHFVPTDQKPDQAHTLSYQVLPKVFIQNASIDVTKPQTIWNKNSITGDCILSFEMNEKESLDINTPRDLAVAQMLLKTDKVGS